MSRRAVAVIASMAVIALVIVVIALSLVPLPDFAALEPGQLSGSVAFVDEENCVLIADLERASVDELRCEPEQGWIDELAWSDRGIEITAYLNQPTTRVLDPSTGEVVDTLVGDEVIVEPPENAGTLLVDRRSENEVVIFDENGRELLSLPASERYWVEVAAPSPDGEAVAFVDSLGRLAVFDRKTVEPTLVFEDVRSWPYPVWRP